MMDMKKSTFLKKTLYILFFTFYLISNSSVSAVRGSTDALLVIGSSYAKGTTRLDDNQLGSLAGLSVGSGGYLSLGDALVRERSLNGLVINEANVGNTTFDRYSCLAYECLPFGKLLGYQAQFENALKRVAIYDLNAPELITEYNAKYLLIGVPNDCIHSDAFGVPQVDTHPCTQKEINELADNVIEIANQAESLGIIAIIPILPKYESLDLDIVQQGLGLKWVVNEYQYNDIRDTLVLRFENELENALIVDIWKKFKHRGDGIHPNRKTVRKAARHISRIIRKHKEM